jgi:hypothetical protein
MKLTRNLVRLFEFDQEQYGTSVALCNMLWLTATELLTDIGVKNIKTVHKNGSGKKGQRTKAVDLAPRFKRRAQARKARRTK